MLLDSLAEGRPWVKGFFRAMAYRYSAAYLRATRGVEENVDSEFQERILGLFEEGTSERAKEEYWRERGESELTMLARNSRLVG